MIRILAAVGFEVIYGRGVCSVFIQFQAALEVIFTVKKCGATTQKEDYGPETIATRHSRSKLRLFCEL
jgi:hypothetical protein